MRELVDPDPDELVERLEASPLLGRYPGQDPADRQPGDPHQLRNRPLRALAGEPGDLILEAAREARVVARPGDGGDDHAVAPALDPGRLRLQVAAGRGQVERPPAPPALALVVAGAAAPTDPAAAPLAPIRVHVHNQRAVPVELDPLNDRPLDTEQPPHPYPCLQHAVSLLSRSDPRKPET